MPLLGTSPEAIDLAEDRGRFGAVLERLGLKAPPYATAHGSDAALAAAPGVGFPLLVRPSYVLGGRAMELVYSTEALADYLHRTGANGGREIYLDRFLENAIEVDVDAICDGEDVWIGGIMQHVEEAGIHSGDSACVLPPHSLGAHMLREIREATAALALELGVVGLINVQYGVLGEDLYVIEANPRASRTVPFVSKATGLPLAKIACRVMLGERLADMDLPDDPGGDHISVKEAVMPFDRFAGADALLGPEMRSTGEVMGIAADFPAAFAKAQAAAGARLPQSGTVFLTVTDTDKAAIGAVAAQLHDLGFSIAATSGTAGAIARMGIPVERLNKLGEGSPHVVDKIEGGDVVLVINTPTGTAARRDGYEIRRAAIARGDPLHHDDRRRHGRGASDRRRAPRRPGGAVAAGDPPRERRGRRGGRLVSAAPAAERTLAPLGRRRARRSSARREYGAYVVLSVADPDGPAPDPGQFAMLARPSAGAAGPTSGRSCRARSRSRGATTTGRSTSCSRTSAPARSGSPSCDAGDDSGCSARSGAASPRRARRAGRSSSAAASGSRRWRSGRTGSAPGRSCCSGFRDAAHAEGAALLARRAGRDRRRLASATTGS